MTQDFNPMDEMLRDEIERMTPEQRQIFTALEVKHVRGLVEKQNGRVGSLESWRSEHTQTHAKLIGAKELLLALLSGGTVALFIWIVSKLP